MKLEPPMVQTLTLGTFKNKGPPKEPLNPNLQAQKKFKEEECKAIRSSKGSQKV